MLDLNATAKQSLSLTFLEAVQQYYAEPRNMEKFEEWQRNRTIKEDKSNGE